MKSECDKPLVNLAVGEPKAENGFPCPQELNTAVIDSLLHESNDYTDETGCDEAK